MTIVEAIKAVLLNEGQPLSIKEIYAAITKGGLYTFNSANPINIVTGQVRRHCKGMDFASASDTKYFEFVGDGKYTILAQSVKEKTGAPARKDSNTVKTLLKELKAIKNKYTSELRAHILGQLKKLDPQTFEEFSQKLLQAYGFEQVNVTRFSKDGGIDGTGKLKVGLAHLNVAFQCKRYTKGAVSRVEIDAFRGAIQGQYEQGIFFTTSSFAAGAEAVSFKSGAVPIILIDGETIVDIMLDKRFGVQAENIIIYSYALDLALTEEVSVNKEITQTEGI